MAGTKIYDDIVYQIVTLLKQGELYPKYVESIDGGKNDYKISQVYTKKNYSTEWIDTLEDCIVALDTIVRNPRKFIVIEEDIVDISLARSISVESVKHLSQHTNLISSVTKDGMVIPSKILNTSQEESFEIYENRFIYTLLLKIKDFIEIRSNAIKGALMQSGELGVEVDSEFAVNKNKVRYKMSGNANFPFDAVVKRSGGGVSDLDRINRIKSIINDFLSSPFAREMRSCALVRPPIQRTNVILKDPNFKKALVLWQYIETSEKMEYKIETSTETVEMNPIMADKFRAIVYLNTILMQSIASTHETSESLESAQKKEKVIADEYVTKNIDDYVPDDFPQLKLDIEQIRTIYKKIPTEKTLTIPQINKINGALDRVIRQYRINKLKEDSVMRQQLIEKQLEEEKQAKLLALREKKDLERRLRADRARKRLELKRQEEERIAEAKRLEEEEAELRRKQAEIEAQLAAKRKELEEIEHRSRALEEEFQREADAKMAIVQAEHDKAQAELNAAQADYDAAISSFKKEEAELEEERRRQMDEEAQLEIKKQTAQKARDALLSIATAKMQSAQSMEEKKKQTLANMREESAKFWENERRTVVRLGISKNLAAIKEQGKAKIQEIADKEQKETNVLRMIEEHFKLSLESDSLKNIQKLAEIAYDYGNSDDIDRVINDRIREVRKMQKERKKQAKQNGKRKPKS
ncbi:MAG: hypothetical protein NC179_02600 [[Eubacterium] siraeum]|nr:hypothetical protein [[Eubacterium] siraeum]